MTQATFPSAARRPLTIGRAILLGGLTIGTLDALDAFIFFGVRNGVTPGRIFQSIAVGALGKSAFQGGAGTIALGAFFHYFIAFSIATVYALASRRVPLLVKQPVLCGMVYGVLVYGFMNAVVLPLSAAGTPHPALIVMVNGVLIHMLGVGLPAAYFASRIAPARN